MSPQNTVLNDFVFSFSGYSNDISFKSIGEKDIDNIETFVRNKLDRRITEKSKRLNYNLTAEDKSCFYGRYVDDIQKFAFNQEERIMILDLVDGIKKGFVSPTNIQKAEIPDINQLWFFKNATSSKPDIIAPPGAKNLLEKIQQTAMKNANRPKQGFRYDNELKRYAVYHRMLAGPLGYNTVQLNLPGCFPSISTTNRYIHRTDHTIIEGELRTKELYDYLVENKQPLWVILSEDATRVSNRVQYDIRSNQLIGFVLATNESTRMPIPFTYKARNACEILNHFSKDLSVAHQVNTVMAQPLGGAPAFCLTVFGSNNIYSSQTVAKRWTFIQKEIKKIGVNVLALSSDSDSKYNAAMRIMSRLGHKTVDSPSGEFFKCGTNTEPPYCIQDYPHLAVRLRGVLLRTIKHPTALPFGKSHIQVGHLQELMNRFSKDRHLLTNTTLNPNDRQNFESVLRICDRRVIELLEKEVEGSEATVVFLQLISNLINVFMDQRMKPVERLEKMWFSLFIVRIWRTYIKKKQKCTLKNNFLSAYNYICIELNAHNLVFILLFLKKNKMTHLFSPHLLCSQPCEKFYRQIRSFTSTYSTVVNCSVKEILGRITKIELQNNISSDEKSGLIFPHALKATNMKNILQFNYDDFPSSDKVESIISGCREKAIEMSERLGLIRKSSKKKDLYCACQITPFEPKKCVSRPAEKNVHESSMDPLDELEVKMMGLSMKNFADKFDRREIEETSPYVEVSNKGKRVVLKKTSLCWWLRKDTGKLSSDRRFRVMSCQKKEAKIMQKRNGNSKTRKRYAKYI